MSIKELIAKLTEAAETVGDDAPVYVRSENYAEDGLTAPDITVYREVRDSQKFVTL